MKNLKRLLLAVMFRGSAIVCSLLVTVVLTRNLSVDGFGHYAFVLSIVVIASMVFEAGLPHLVVREVAAHDQGQDHEHVKGVLLRAIQFSLVFSGIVFAAWILFREVLGDAISATEAELLTVALLALPFVALLGVFSGALRAFERYFAGQFLSLLAVRMANLALLGIMLALPVFGGFDPLAAMFAFVISYMLAAGIATALLWTHVKYDWRTIRPSFKTREWLSALFPLTVIAGLQIIVTKTDIIMLRALSGPADVGIYHLATQMGNLAFIAKSGVMMVVGPRFARLYRDNKHEALQSELSFAARFVFITGVPIVLTLIVFGRPLLETLFGAPFEAAYEAMIALCLGYLVLALFGSVDTLLKMTHNEAVVLRTIGIAIILNLCLNALLIPVYGPLGAAISTATAMIVWRVILTRQAYHLLNLVSFAFYQKSRP